MVLHADSFKSKRYRDKLREQIKALENLLPVDKATLHRKLDSQTVFRLAISFFRIKSFLSGKNIISIIVFIIFSISNIHNTSFKSLWYTLQQFIYRFKITTY